MKSLYDIIKSLQTTQGSKAKQKILDENWNNELLREYLKAMLDPAINYYQTKIKSRKNAYGFCDLGLIEIKKLTEFLASRYLTGARAKDWLTSLYETSTKEGQELLTYLIKRKIDKANVGETMVLKTWPGLFFVPPYQRCSLLNEKTKKKFENQQYFYIQTKLDGSFAYGVDCDGTKEVITRAGSKYPDWFANKLLIASPVNQVVVGEMLVFDGELLNRQTGNGILNSILQGGDEKDFEKYDFHFVAWDLLPLTCWELGSCDEPYCDRFDLLEKSIGNSPTIFLIWSDTITSMHHAFDIYQEHLERGEEGCVLKHPLSMWKDGTATDIVKLKLKFQVDLKIVGFYEGTGKAAGMLGGLELETSDGLLKTDCGSGFDDETRKSFWGNRNSLIGKIVTVEANDVGTKRGSDVKSLFLPIFIEIRNDKKEADSLARVMEQLEAAKRGEL